MRTFTLYLLFLIIAALILSFSLRPRPLQPILIVREPEPSPVRRLTFNPWSVEKWAESPFFHKEQTMTSRMEKASYDLREGLSF